MAQKPHKSNECQIVWSEAAELSSKKDAYNSRTATHFILNYQVGSKNYQKYDEIRVSTSQNVNVSRQREELLNIRDRLHGEDELENNSGDVFIPNENDNSNNTS